MKTYVEGELKIVSKQSFAGENGETVEYFENYLKDDEDEMLIFNSKKDFTESEGKHGVAVLGVKKYGKDVKVSFVDFIPGAEMETPQADVN